VDRQRDANNAVNFLKILFVDASRNGWGTEQHLVSLARALAETGHSVSAVVKRGSPVAELLTVRGIRTHATAFRGGADPRGILTIMRAIRADQPDWIVTNRGKLYWTLWAIARLMGVRVALFRHLPDVRRWVTRCVLPRLVDRFFVVSEFSRARLVAGGAPLNRLSVLYNPIDIDDLQCAASLRLETRLRLGIAPDDFVIGFVGRVELGKGIKVLWDAVAPLMARLEHIRLLCVGDGPELITWQRKADTSKVGARCHFVGWTNKVSEFYSAMDLLIAPSIAPETFCRVVAEAQARRIAVIGSQMGGIPEAFEPGSSGLLIAPDDHRALQRSIQRLHDDGDLRSKFAGAGHTYARKHFAAHKIAADFIANLSESLGTPLLPALDVPFEEMG
jgi:glycosyltransferase involved in cell wall biosynthesis